MGDIIKTFNVRSTSDERPRRLKFYFDTGSPRTFIKESAVKGMKELAKLSVPVNFRGMGNGGFQATSMAHIGVQLLGIWVPHFCYVVPDDVLGPEYDILLGHDFMQIYDIQIRPKEKDIIVRKNALQMALKVR